MKGKWMGNLATGNFGTTKPLKKAGDKSLAKMDNFVKNISNDNKNTNKELVG